MKHLHLYFLSDQYYKDFPDPKLMRNKEAVGAQLHRRPFFFPFKDEKIPDIYWLVPISSQVDKFKIVAKKKEIKYGHCNTIRFGQVLGREAAFLIQNMCPVTAPYLLPYMDSNLLPVYIRDDLAEDVIQNAKSVLRLLEKYPYIVFPAVQEIYIQLSKQLIAQTVIAEAKQEAADRLRSITQDPTEGRRR